MAKVAAKAAKPAAKKAASAKSKERKSASGKPTAAAVPLPRARPGSSGASARARASASDPHGASTGLAKPPAVPLAAQTSDPDLALVKSAIDSARSGDADKATRIEATISDPVARKLVEWIIFAQRRQRRRKRALHRFYFRQSELAEPRNAPQSCRGVALGRECQAGADPRLFQQLAAANGQGPPGAGARAACAGRHRRRERAGA